MKLDSIIIGNHKLFVNLPRYQKREVQERLTKEVGMVEETVGQRLQIARHISHRDTRSFVEVLGVDKDGAGTKRYQLEFNCDEGAVWQRFNKAFIGKVMEGGLSYNMQDIFDLDGYFNIKVTPLGSNLCLLEGRGEGDIDDLVVYGESWLKKWFQSVLEWDPTVVELERVVWIRAFGIPFHAWGGEFFGCISKTVGCFLRMDDDTREHKRMDMARLLVKTSCLAMMNEKLVIKINGCLFRIMLVKESLEPLHSYSAGGRRLGTLEAEESVTEDVDGSMFGMEGDEIAVALKIHSEDEAPNGDTGCAHKESRDGSDVILCKSTPMIKVGGAGKAVEATLTLEATARCNVSCEKVKDAFLSLETGGCCDHKRKRQPLSSDIHVAGRKCILPRSKSWNGSELFDLALCFVAHGPSKSLAHKNGLDPDGMGLENSDEIERVKETQVAILESTMPPIISSIDGLNQKDTKQTVAEHSNDDHGVSQERSTRGEK